MKNVALVIRNFNWGLAGPFDWRSKKWVIYTDCTVDYSEEYFSQNNERTYQLPQKQFKRILKDIQLAKKHDEHVEACDGEGWEFIEYHNGVATWRREAGYIYGIAALEDIENILKTSAPTFPFNMSKFFESV